MRSFVVLAVFLAVAAVCSASSHKCCPQPENDDAGKCGCCPDACCCICETTIVTAPPITTQTLPPQTTSEICMLFGLDIVFVVDNSVSIDDQDWQQALDALKFIVNSDAWAPVGTETRFSMIIYSNEADVIFGINDAASDSVANLEAAIDSAMGPRNLTGTPLGLKEAIVQLTEPNDRDDRLWKDIAIVVTDGRSNVPLGGARDALIMYGDLLKEATELVYALGILPGVNVEELPIIGDDYQLIPGFEELNETIEDVLKDIQQVICETVDPPTRTPPPVPTTAPPMVVETCNCCCPPLPDPCNNYNNKGDACCCRYGLDDKRRR